MQGNDLPTQPVDMKLLEQLLAAELQAAQAGALAQAQQPQAPSGPISPQMIAQVQHQMSLPLSARPRQSAPQQDNRPLWIAAIAGVSTCVTVLGLAAIVSGSLAGNRGTAELNTAVVALSEATKNAQRPNEICISFNCGGMRRQAEQGQTATAIASPAQAAAPSESEVYAKHYATAKQEAPYIYQGWSADEIATEVARLQQVRTAPGTTPDRVGRIDGFLSHLGGL